MANVSKTVEIIFGGKNEVGKVADEVIRKLDDLKDITGNITEPLAKVGENVLKIDAALAALAIGGMALAIRQSSEFNKSFALISTSITATGGDLAKYRSDVLDYSVTSVKSLADINASLYTAAQAGVKYTDSLGFIRKAEELSVANNANLNTTVDLLTGTMNAYGFTLKDVAHLNDVFFQSTLIGKQTIDELGTSMGGVVAIAANSGVSFEELSAAIATLTAKGMKTEDAITAVKNVITTIISPSREAGEAAKGLGLNFSLTELTAKGFAAMLQEIMARTGGSKEQLVSLFNEVRAMNGVLQLAGDGGKFFSDALSQIQGASGASEAAYQKMVASFANQTQMMLNVANVTMVEIGTRLEPAAARIGGAFASLLAGIRIGVDQGAFDPLFAYLDQVGGALAARLQEIAAAFPEALQKVDFQGLIASLNALGEAIGAYFGELDLTKADDLASALQLLVDIASGLIRVTAGMADAFRPFVSVIADFFIELARGGQETQETIGKILTFAQAVQGMGLGVAAAILAIDEFGVSMHGVFNTIAGGAQVMWNGFEILLTAIKGLFLAIEGTFVQLLDKLTFGLFPGLKNLTSDIAKQGEQINASFAQNGADAARGLARLTDGLIKLGSETGSSETKVKKLKEGLAELPAEKSIAVKVSNVEETKAQVAAIKTAVAELPAKREVGVVVREDGSSIEKAYGMIVERFPNGEVRVTQGAFRMDDGSLVQASAALEKAVPGIKNVEVSAKLEKAALEKLKKDSDIVQKTIEWKGKVDIAQIESAAKRVEATFKSVDNSITSTGTLMGSMMGDLLRASGTGQSGFIESEIRAESKRRDEALEMQKKTVAAEVDLMKAKARALSQGKALIEIDGKGLQPHLEAFMFEVLKAIQVRATAEGASFLVG